MDERISAFTSTTKILTSIRDNLITLLAKIKTGKILQTYLAEITILTKLVSELEKIDTNNATEFRRAIDTCYKELIHLKMALCYACITAICTKEELIDFIKKDGSAQISNTMVTGIMLAPESTKITAAGHSISPPPFKNPRLILDIITTQVNIVENSTIILPILSSTEIAVSNSETSPPPFKKAIVLSKIDESQNSARAKAPLRQRPSSPKGHNQTLAALSITMLSKKIQFYTLEAALEETASKANKMLDEENIVRYLFNIFIKKGYHAVRKKICPSNSKDPSPRGPDDDSDNDINESVTSTSQGGF